MAASAASSPSVVNLYVAPRAPGLTAAAAAAAETGAAQHPFTSVAQAAQSAHQLSASSDVVVHLAAGKYQLTQPLTFTSADAGQNGHTISYAGAAAAATVMSGSAQVTGWTLQNQSSNIWVANVGTGVNTRQLYVNGAEAPRAAISVPRSDFTFTSTGLTITSSSLNYLAGLTDQNQIEVESVDSFTDRYAPVSSISGSTITMQQPGWANNNFGYDVLAQPFAGGAMYLENNYSFLQQAGQWYLDSPTGQLFYKAASGQNPSSLDIELPKTQTLLNVSGSYSSPVSGLSFSNIDVHRHHLARAERQPGIRGPADRRVHHRQLVAAVVRRLLQRLPAVRGHPAELGPDARRRPGLRGQQHHLQRRHLHRPGRGRPRHRPGPRRQPPAAPAWAPATSPSPATRSAMTPAAGSWSAGSRPTPTTPATRR